MKIQEEEPVSRWIAIKTCKSRLLSKTPALTGTGRKGRIAGAK